jgi:hypothetical protein
MLIEFRKTNGEEEEHHHSNEIGNPDGADLQNVRARVKGGRL